MSLQDTLLNQMAGVINGESFISPSYVGFSSTAITVDATDTSLPGEYGSRITVSGSRNLNEVTLSGIRTGATVASTGDALNSFGLFTSSADGFLHAEALVASLLHTTSFDVEVDWLIKVDRKG